MKKRNIALCVVLYFITCGIFSLFWFVWLNDDTYALANPEKKTSGGVALLLNIITCGIYGWFWIYKMGQLLDDALVQRGQVAQNRAVLYLILQLIGFGFISWILMQNTINSMIPEQAQ